MAKQPVEKAWYTGHWSGCTFMRGPPKVFHSSPNGGHFGATATMKRMGGVAYWKGLKKDVHQFVQACIVYQ